VRVRWSIGIAANLGSNLAELQKQFSAKEPFDFSSDHT
jgi:hypothetical protein